MKSMCKVSVVACCILIVQVFSAFANVIPPGDTLYGLPGVYISVEKNTPDSDNDESQIQQIQKDVELQLRRVGIPVLTKEECIVTIGKPYLQITVDSAKDESTGLCSILVGVSLRQEVYLSRVFDMDRELVKTSCSTWSKRTVGTVDSGEMNFISDRIKDMVDSFVRDYLAANH